MLFRWAIFPLCAALLPAFLLQAVVLPPASPSPAGLYRHDCQACHGSQGEGGIGPQLAGRHLAAAKIEAQILHGGLVMPAFAPSRISPAQTAALAAWIDALPAPSAATLIPAPHPHAPAATVFATRCALCHGPQARGLVGPGLLDTALTQAQFVTFVRHGGGVMPPFPSSRLDSSSLGSIYAWLHTGGGTPAPGTAFALPTTPDYPLFSLLGLLFILGLLLLEARRRARRARACAREEIENAEFLLEVLSRQKSDGLNAQIF